MNEYLVVRPLPWDPLELDPSLQEMMDGLYVNPFALFLVKIIQPSEKEQIKQITRKLESVAAGYIQNNRELLDALGDPDLIWDIYLVLLTHGEISVETRVELENDRFYCKKVILPYQPTQSIVEHLLTMTIFQQFDDTVQREGKYVEKDAFINQLLVTIKNPILKNFMKKNDLLKAEEQQLIARFRKDFGLEVGEADV